jgi:hypothetical protein
MTVFSQTLSALLHYYCRRYVPQYLHYFHLNVYVQLPDPKAKSFTTRTLQQAMLDTIATLNLYADEAGITEVS